MVLLRFGEVPYVLLLSAKLKETLRWWKTSVGEVDMERLRDTSRRRGSESLVPFC